MQFQPLTISTYCIFNRPQFRHKRILAFSPNSVELLFQYNTLLMNQTAYIIGNYS